MKITIDKRSEKDGFLRIIPYGAIDFTTYQEFDEKIKPLIIPPLKGLIIDLVNVDYISSSGLGSLLSAKKAVLKINGQLIFCNLKPQIKKLFEILRALPAENVFEDIEEADQYLFRMTNGDKDAAKE